MKIGLFGGSFDPVHCGHLLVAQAALEELGLDGIVFIPAAQSPFKAGCMPTAPSVRLRLLRLALVGRPEFQVEPLELERGGISYTIDTVEHLTRLHPGAELHWLIGADHVATLPLWREAARLATLVEFVVIPRPGVDKVEPPSGFRFHWLHGWPLGVSSSLIRERAALGQALNQMVPEAVAAAILSEKLYQGPATR